MNRYLLRGSIAAVSTALMAVPALAQSSDQPVEEGAGIIAWILVGLIGAAREFSAPAQSAISIRLRNEYAEPLS